MTKHLGTMESGMKIKKTVTVDAEVTHLLAEMGVRYWEDGVVNGERDDETNPKMPFAKNGIWRILIDLDSGVIADWPKGTTASVHYKVCDEGVYSLFCNGELVTEKAEYVPAMLSPGGRGFGDYVIMSIDEHGKIGGWRADLAYFEDDA